MHSRLSDAQYAALVSEVQPMAREAARTARTEEEAAAALERIDVVIKRHHAQAAFQAAA